MTDSDDSPIGANNQGNDYPLAADDSAPPWQRPVNLPLVARQAEEEIPSADQWQFTLSELFLLTAVFALLLGLLKMFPREWAAGLAGAGALVSMIVLAVLKPTRMIVYLGWWAMLIVYLMVCLAAILGGAQ